MAPFRPGVKPENWITVAAANTENDKPRWSPDGRTLYFTSLRDGFRCIWAQGLNPITKIPSGEPSATIHFHSAVRSISNVPLFVQELAVASDRLVFVLGAPRQRLADAGQMKLWE